MNSPLQRGFEITSSILVFSASLQQVPKLPAGQGIDYSSEKETRCVNDPHPANAGTIRTARTSVLKSKPRSLFISRYKSSVETRSNAAWKMGPKSVVKKGRSIGVKGEQIPVICPSGISNAITNVSTKLKALWWSNCCLLIGRPQIGDV